MNQPDPTESPTPPPDDPSIPSGAIAQPTSNQPQGDGYIHKVLRTDLDAYLSGAITTVTAVCGLVWAPNVDSNHTDTQEMCPKCFPVYANAS